MKKKYRAAVLVAVMMLLLTGCSIEGIPSFQAMMLGEPELVELPYNPLDYVTLGQYKDIEVEAMVTESDLQDAVDSLIVAGGNDMKSDEKVVKKGALINFDYAGKIGGKEFDGGTAEDQYLRVGSGKMIDGFEDALVGMKVGGQKDAKMKFPENYSNTELAGKDVVFTLKVNYIYKEADDAFVAKQSEQKTVKEFKEAKKKELEEQNKQNSLQQAMNKVAENAKIKEVPKALLENIKKVESKTLENQAAQSGMDVSTMLQMYGMTENSYYEIIGKQRLLCEAVAQEEGYRITKEKFNEKLDEILKQVDMTEEEYRKKFKEATSKEASLEDYLVYNMKYDFFYDLVNSTMKQK